MRTTTTVVIALAALAWPAAAKDPAQGKTPGAIYEGYMSPQQQPGEESNAPKLLQKATGLESTGTSTPREQRKSLGWGQLRFARDLSKVWVDVEITGVNPADILMFHIHCGAPGILGPIVVDFGQQGSLPKLLASGKLSLELRNKDLTYLKDMPRGLKPALPEGCPIDPAMVGQLQTIAGLDMLARKGVLYFNLNTKQHTFYGEVRGQIYAVKE
jgi:hypothetical protein